MPTYEILFADASQLPVAERVQLIEALWDTVPDEARPSMSQQWLQEIADRSAEYDAGRVETIPWENIREAALRRLADENR